MATAHNCIYCNFSVSFAIPVCFKKVNHVHTLYRWFAYTIRRARTNGNPKAMKSHYALPVMTGLLLAACGSLRVADSKTGVGIGGVNYSDQPIFYALSDPNNPASVGGEPVDPFGAGGLICCFSLPDTWQPGIKVRVQIFDTNMKDVKDEIVDLPPYVEGKPGQLWAVHHQDGRVEVFSSIYGPPHAKWPARIKGWPVPTVEYRRKLWELHLNDKKGAVRAAERLIKRLNENPEKSLREQWEHDKRYSMEEIESFSGPEDPRYKASLMKRNDEFLRSAQERLNDWIGKKP
jgi:hypothetical protein